ncbi:2-iminobutanoate/2-iminopropanoate deaminase [Ruminococcaceae bacterium YRB3002]|nr:2-iminobutanoate/2-iminopropanoate deaminase [Ruminococcaceae bacterium YRB3002]
MYTIATNAAPEAIGPYAQAQMALGFIFVSGQIPIDPSTGTILAETIIEQTRQVCKNIQVILQAAGSDMTKVVKTTCYLADMEDFNSFNAIYSEYFTNKPARSCVAVKALPKGALVEIEVIAEKN